jgi:RNA polymerase sigma-70 factor, ECF subfamily
LEAEELFARHSAMVYNLALRLCGNAADAQDLAQDVFVKAIRALAGLREDSFSGTWLYRITVNAWKNRLRAGARRGADATVTLDAGDEAGAQPASPEARPEEAAERAGRKAALERALAALTPEDRAMLALRELDGRSYEEIAAVLEVPLGTVKSRLSRAREALRLKLEKLL